MPWAALLLPLLPLLASARAQDPATGEEGAYAMPGCWQAADGRIAALGPGTRSERDFAATAWTCLALLADGSTLRQGPYRQPLRRAVSWLRTQQDAAGFLGREPGANRVLHQALATTVLAEAARDHRPLRRDAARAGSALAAAVQALGSSVRAEELLWAQIVQRTLADVDATAAAATGLAVAVADVVPFVDDGARARTAMTLLPLLSGTAGEQAAPALAPARDTDPLACLQATLGAWLRGGATWRAAGKELEAVVRAQRRDGAEGALRGTWDPPPGSDFGRAETTAITVVTLTIHYRYCRLALAR